MSLSREEVLRYLKGMSKANQTLRLLEELRNIARSKGDERTECDPGGVCCVAIIRIVEAFPDDEEVATWAPRALARFAAADDVWLAARCMWRFPDSAAVQVSAVMCFIHMIRDARVTPAGLQAENVVQMLVQALEDHKDDVSLQMLGRYLIALAVGHAT